MKAFPRDITVEKLTERHIGIENELFTGQDGRSIADDILDVLNKRGLLYPSVGYDGGGREFRTVPIRCKALKQKRGCKYINEYYETLKSVTKPIDRGGTHIHISILDKDHENMESNATALGIAFFEQFQKIAGRDTHWAYNLGIRGDTDTLERVRKYLNGRRATDQHRVYYAKGAILSPTSHKTLEFRGPKGSNNVEEILAWVEFLENVIKRSNRKTVHGVCFADLLKGERIEAYVSKLKGWRKLTEADLNKKVNVNALI